MKNHTISIFAGLVATSTLALAAIPAQAFSLNPANDGTFTAKAGDMVDFTFLESHGMFRSDFGIYNAGTMALVSNLFSEKAPGYDPGSNDPKNDWEGTCGKTVTACTVWYKFANAGTYKFGLTAPAGKTEFTEHTGNFASAATAPMPGIISTADSYTFDTTGPTALSQGKPHKFKTIDTSPYDFFVAINDSNKVDGDIQDFIVGAKVKSVPEPAALGGLGLVAGAMTFLRRRKNNQAS